MSLVVSYIIIIIEREREGGCAISSGTNCDFTDHRPFGCGYICT